MACCACSVPDLITDVAMARSGFGNMAMTACFAGPLCNMLCGLGLGFLLQIMKSSQSYTPVVRPPKPTAYSSLCAISR